MSSDLEMRKERFQRKRQAINKIMLIPVVCVLGIIPLIVRLTYVEPGDARMYFLFKSTSLQDYYSQYKSIGIIVLTIIMTILFITLVEETELKKEYHVKLYLLCTGVFLGMSFISSLMSEYKEISWFGVYNRAEGLFIWICYLVMMFYTFYVIQNKRGYKWIIVSLAFVVGINGILGFFQYINYDLFINTKWGQALIIPEQYRTIGQTIGLKKQTNEILGTLYHHNYMGSFCAMVVPLFATLMFMIKGIKKKIALGIVTTIGMFLLLGSESRAGIIGVVLAGTVAIILLTPKLIENKKKLLIGTISILLVGSIGLIGINAISDGKIFKNMSTLKVDIEKLLGLKNEQIDYTTKLPIREVKQENGEITLVLQKNSLVIKYIDGEVYMLDDMGKEIDCTVEDEDYIMKDGTVYTGANYTILDKRYNFLEIVKEPINIYEKQEVIEVIKVKTGKGNFCFKLSETGIQWIDSFSGEPLDMTKPDTIGFEGKERLGSSRGYIWSRSLPIFIKRNLIIGNGPDTYIGYFPQGEPLLKWYLYGASNTIIDKPHCLYLQIGINHGGIALIAFLALNIIYLLHSIKLYAFRKIYDVIDAMGIGIMLAIIGYLGAGLFNDSVVSVAPIFWILLGTGMATNYMKEQEKVI